MDYADGFAIEELSNGVTQIEVFAPWPEAAKSLRYALVPKTLQTEITLDPEQYDAIIPVPVNSVVVTSTTHIPSLEMLDVDPLLVGFPGLDYVSSIRTRKRIDQGQVKELGNNETLNTEYLLELQPELVIGFAVSGMPESYRILEKSGIPVVLNGDWVEQSPLGKAEWIRFFAPFFGKESQALEAFEAIEQAYLLAKQEAAASAHKPTVLSGALYRDVWYLPGGRSWAAQILEDAHADYLWKDSPEQGSVSLSLEAVYEKGGVAEHWISPSQYTSYQQMLDANSFYERFEAFKNKKVYSYAGSRGPTGGLYYYELGPARPDLILKDLIYYLHPGTLKNYSPTFFKPLNP